MKKVATAEAFANIALIKYWGKEEREGNYPAVPSLSITLQGLRTLTRVTLDSNLNEDSVLLDGAVATGRARDRVVGMLDAIRSHTSTETRAVVESRNEFPTAAGLASSASGFAALVCAANGAFEAGLSTQEMSSLARAASASAARSLYGGFSVLPAGADHASPLAPQDHWDLVLLVAITTSGPKPIGSTSAMNRTRSTSPYYPTWVTFSKTLFERAKEAVLSRQLTELGEAMEQSTLMMHATMHAASPAIIYQLPASVAAISEVHKLRQEGTPCYFTMDAGPHVKVLCERQNMAVVKARLAAIPGVTGVIVATPGPSARLIEGELF